MPVSDQSASATISPDEKTLMGLTPQDVANFNDPHLEFRQLVAEFIGSFLLVPFILGLGRISGAHFNPMVTLALALRTVFPWKRVPAYVIVQFVGGLCAALFLQATLGKIANDGASTAVTDLSGMAVGMWEAFFTFILIAARYHRAAPKATSKMSTTSSPNSEAKAEAVVIPVSLRRIAWLR